MSNLFVYFLKYDQDNDVDCFHVNISDLVHLTDSSFPHAIHNLAQVSKCNYLTFESSEICEGVEALQILLMVMLSYHNINEIPKQCQIWIFSHNYFL